MRHTIACDDFFARLFTNIIESTYAEDLGAMPYRAHVKTRKSIAPEITRAAAAMCLAVNIAFTCTSSADDVTFGFASIIGGRGWEAGHDIALDAAGNVHITGVFDKSWGVDFDPGVGTANSAGARYAGDGFFGHYDIFVEKFDTNGNFIWAKEMGGKNHESGTGIAVDVSGNVYTTGVFSDTVDFDPGQGTVNMTSAGAGDVFVQKLDADGNFLWAKSMGGKKHDIGTSISVDVSGDVYTTGWFRKKADFDPGEGVDILTGSGIFVQKLDSDGELVWVKAIHAKTSMRVPPLFIANDASGNVYITGNFFKKADFDPGAGVANFTAAGNGDIFVLKLDSEGEFVWAKTMGGKDGDGGSDIVVDASGNVYITGWFSETVDFDPGAGTASFTSSGKKDIFVQKLDGDGNFIWAKTMGGKNLEHSEGIAVDASGNVYITGYFNGSTDFDPGEGTTNLVPWDNNDFFIQKLDTNGNFMWVKVIGGNGDDLSASISVDAMGSLYTTGRFTETVNFDPGTETAIHTSMGAGDIFVYKLEVGAFPTPAADNR